MTNLAVVSEKKSIQKFQALEKVPVRTYAELKAAVRERFALGRTRVWRDIVSTYLESGVLISRHLEENKKEATHGKGIVLKLARELGWADKDRSNIYRSLELARTYRKVAPGRLLSMSHQKWLLGVPDEIERVQFAEQAERLGWTRDELGRAVKQAKSKKRSAQKARLRKNRPLDPPNPGVFFTARVVGREKVVTPENALWIDQGFSVYKKIPAAKRKGLKAGDIVSFESRGDSLSNVKFLYRPKKKNDPASPPLFTYRVFLQRVVDGDTLFVAADLGFETVRSEYLRLRGVDAPEISTRSGKTAKAFLEKFLSTRKDLGPPVLTLRTSKTDLHGRYVADVFKRDGTYVNQLLLDRGFAKRA